MSIVYSVIVPEGKWPTFAEMNALLRMRSYPLEVIPHSPQTKHSPMAEHGGFLSFACKFRGELQEMDCYHVVYDACRVEDTDNWLESIGSPFRTATGMHHWDFSFGPKTPPQFLIPYLLIATTLVLDCDGYGCEGQAPSFGKEDWANDLLAAAKVMAKDLPKVVARHKTRRTIKGIPINLWTILAVIVILLLIAEGIDQHIWNFTGT